MALKYTHCVMRFPVFLLFVGLFVFSNLVAGGMTEEDWVDPFDMINYDRTTKSMYKKEGKQNEASEVTERLVALQASMHKCEDELKVCRTEKLAASPQQKAPVQETCTQSELYMRRFVNILLQASRLTEEMPLNLDTTLRVSVSPEQLQILQQFSKGGKDISLQHLEGVLSSVLLSATTSFYSPDSVLWRTLVDSLLCRETLMALFLGFLPVFLVWKVLSGHSVVRVFIIFIISAFMISFSVTYCRMYKQEEIRQFSLLKKSPDIPVQCRPPSDLTWMETVQKLLSSQLSSRSDECLKYYEAVMMDPFLKVTPTVVLSEMIAGFLLHPSGMLGAAIANFSNSILGNLPFGTNYIVLVGSFFLVIALVFASCGGVIRLPFYLGGVELAGRRPVERIAQKPQTEPQEPLSSLLKAVDSIDSGLFITNMRGIQLLSSSNLLKDSEAKKHVPGCCGESKTSCQHQVAPALVEHPSPVKRRKEQAEELRQRSVPALVEHPSPVKLRKEQAEELRQRSVPALVEHPSPVKAKKEQAEELRQRSVSALVEHPSPVKAKKEQAEELHHRKVLPELGESFSTLKLIDESWRCTGMKTDATGQEDEVETHSSVEVLSVVLANSSDSEGDRLEEASFVKL